MRRAGRLSATFLLPSGGTWNLWLQGQIMSSVRVSVDGRSLGSIGGQLGGNSLVPDTMTPLQAPLAAGPHRLSVARRGLSLAPGDGGAAVLDAIFLAPAAAPARQLVRVAPGGDWRSLCGHTYAWIELVKRVGRAPDAGATVARTALLGATTERDRPAAIGALRERHRFAPRAVGGDRSTSERDTRARRGRGAVNATTLAPAKRRPTRRLIAIGPAAGGSSSTITDISLPSPARKLMTSTFRPPAALNALGTGRAPMSALVSSSAYHSGCACSAPSPGSPASPRRAANSRRSSPGQPGS